MNTNTTAYVYKWTHIPTLNWYVGSRTRQGCHTEDGYVCSSDTVKNLISTNPADWRRDIIATGTPKEMREYEATILDCMDAVLARISYLYSLFQ